MSKIKVRQFDGVGANPGDDARSNARRKIGWLAKQQLTVLLIAPFVLMSFPNYGRGAPADLAGSWSGGGWVSFSSGSREKARCRARYVANSENSYSLSATCATASGSVSQTATLRKAGANSYSGSFHNSQYDVSGTIYVTLQGNSQSVTLSSNSGSASLTLSR
jgi:hypothetical protein